MRNTRSVSAAKRSTSGTAAPSKDHPVNRQVISDMIDGMGATIMGRNMFGPIRGDWGDSEWKGGGVTNRRITARSSS